MTLITWEYTDANCRERALITWVYTDANWRANRTTYTHVTLKNYLNYFYAIHSVINPIY